MGPGSTHPAGSAAAALAAAGATTVRHPEASSAAPTAAVLARWSRGTNDLHGWAGRFAEPAGPSCRKVTSRTRTDKHSGACRKFASRGGPVLRSTPAATPATRAPAWPRRARTLGPAHRSRTGDHAGHHAGHHAGRHAGCSRGLGGGSSLDRLWTTPAGRGRWTGSGQLPQAVVAGPGLNKSHRAEQAAGTVLEDVPAPPRGVALSKQHQPNPSAPPVQKLRLRYAKRGRLRFTSHRDVARAFERALRRAGIPMAYSQGFNPHPRISWAGAAPTGVASEAEYVEIQLVEQVDPDTVRLELDAALPEGLDVLRVVPAAPGSLADCLEASLWRIELPGVDPRTLAEAADRLLAAERVDVQRLTKDGRRTMDVRPAVLAAEAVPAGDEAESGL